MLVSQFKDDIYATEKELIAFFKFHGIKKKCDTSVARFISDNIKCLQDTYIDKSLTPTTNLENDYLKLVYNFKRSIAPKVRYKIYFNIFMKCNCVEAKWITYFLLGQIPFEMIGLTEKMIDEVLKEVLSMEIKKDVVLTVIVTNRATNKIVDMDFIMKAETLNSIMRDKVHKEFSTIFKETCDKVGTIKNMNKLLYEL